MSHFEKFQMQQVKRSEIKKHPFNPRKITAEAKRRLQLALEKHGLVQPLVLNTRTGNLVSGHQRISVLDILEGSKDYTLNMSCIDVDEAEEKELLVFLNNTSSQGHWSDELLLEIIADEAVNVDALGFSKTELEYFDKLLKESSEQESAAMQYFQETAEAYDSLKESAEENKDEIEEDKKNRKERWMETVDQYFEAPPPKPPEQDVPNMEYRKAREGWKKQDTEPEVILRIVFKSEENKRGWLQRYNQPPTVSVIHEKEWQLN